MLFHGVLGGLVVFTQFAVVHSQMAPAYRVDGAAESQFEGTYVRMATAQCNGKPVYQLGGSDGGDVLFQPEGLSYWLVSTIATVFREVAIDFRGGEPSEWGKSRAPHATTQTMA